MQALVDQEEHYREWLDDQMTPGIRSDSVKIYFSDEAKRLITDTTYRDSIFSYPYSFIHVRDALQTTNLRLAFWYMINLYPDFKKRVLQYISAYDKLIDADQIVVSGFYTYALLDPRITRIVDGKPDIYRPDIMDELFHNMNEIVEYLLTTRSERRPATK